MSKSKKAFRSAFLLTTASFAFGLAQAQQAETTPEDEDMTMSTIVVRGEFIPDEKRETSEISSFLDSADLDVQGDADAAAALRRVTGLSLARGKFIYVRGLNERYSSSTLNGSPLPSPEPLRRVAPLDLFPTSILESIMVQKTYSPEFSAEFGGGLLEMRTKSIPLDNFLEASVSLGGNSETSFNDGLLYDGGDTDWLGYDDGLRDLPPTLSSIYNTERVQNLSTESRIAASQELVDSKLWVLQEGIVGPDIGVTFTGGSRFDVSEALSLGLIASLNYSNSWDTKDGVSRNLQANVRDENGARSVIGNPGATIELEEEDNFSRFSTENNIRFSAFTSFGANIMADHDITFNGLLTRSTSKEANRLDGFSTVDFADGNDVIVDRLEWIEREVMTGQVNGQHVFTPLGNIWNDLDDFEVNWRASYSEASRDAPYLREVVYERDTDDLFKINDVRRNTNEFSIIEDDSQDIGIDGKLPLFFDWLPGKDLEITGGWSYFEANRDTESKIYRFDGLISPESPLNGARVDVLYGDAGIASGNILLREVGGQEFPEIFAGHLELDAFYFKTEIQLTHFFSISGGVRYEDSVQTADTSTFLNDDGLLESAISSQYGLPTFSATWNFTDNMQLRAGYSQTITRPQFREMAFVQFRNTETDESFIGNPFLTNAEITNYDARWEYYFGRDEFITLGLFYKELDNPIEEVSFRFGDANINSFINAPSSTIMGFEAEFEKIIPLDEWMDSSWFQAKDFIFKANYSYNDSEVSADGTVIRAKSASGTVEPDEVSGEAFIIDGRKLQGQSDHIGNLQIGYNDLESGAKLRLLYNYSSERIRRAENRTANTPAIIEQLPASLDLTYQREFDFQGGEYEFSFKLSNILNEDYEAFQEGTGEKVVVDGYDRGLSYSLGLKRVF